MGEVKKMLVNNSVEDYQLIYRSLINSLPFKVFIKDLNLRFVFCNKEFAEFLALQSEEIKGKTNYNFFPYELADKLESIEKKIINGLDSEKIEQVFEINSTKVQVQINLSPLKNENGAIKGILGIISDLQGKYKIEDRYDNIFQTSFDGFCIANSEKTLTYVNDAMCDMLGYKRNDLLGKNIFDLSDEENYPDMYVHFQNVADRGYDRFKIILFGNDEIMIRAEISVTFSMKNDGEYILSVRDISEKIHAEAKLSESEQRYQRLAEISPVGIFHTDLNGKTTFVNSRWCEISGMSYQQALGDGWLNAIHPEDRKRLIDGWKKTVESQKDSITDYRFLRKDGSIAWVMGKAVPEINLEGQIVGYVGTIVDITKRKFAEESTRESEKLYREVVEHSSDLIYTVNVKGQFTFANSTALSVAGYSLEELKKLFYYELVLPEYRSKLKKFYLNQIEQRIPTQYLEFPFRTRSDETKWFGQSTTIKYEGEQIVGLHVIARDITERKIAEEALRESENKFASAFKNSPQAMAITSLDDGKIVDVNDVFLKHTEYTAEELIGSTVAELGFFIDDSDRLRFLDKVREDHYVYGMELRIQIKSGKLLDCLFSSTIITVHSKPHLLTTILDITERKQTERILKQTEQKLQEVLKYSVNLFYSHDTNQVITYVSSQAEKFLACDPEEAKTRWTDFITDNPVNLKGIEYTNRAIKTGKAQPPYELEIRKKNGDLIWVEVNESPVVKYGKTVSIVGSLTDITETKLKEKAVNDERRLLRTLIDNLPDVIYVKDRNCKKVVANKADIKNMGLHSEDEVIGKGDFELFPKEIAEKFYKDDQSVLQTGNSMLNREDYLVDPDGKGKWLLTSKVPLFDEEGNISGLVGIGRDITEKKRTEGILREREHLLKEAQRVARLGYYNLNILTGVWEGSELLNEILGIDKTFQTDVKSWLKIVHPDHRDRMKEYFIHEVLAKHIPFDAEYKISRINDGQVRWVHGLGELEFDENKNPVRMIGTIKDITDRKHDENRIKKINRIYAVLSDINKSIVRIRNPHQLLETVCKIAVDKGQFKIAWIGIVDRSLHKIKLAASASKPGLKKYFTEFKDLLEDEFYSYYPVKGTLWNKQYITGILDPQIEKLASHRKRAYEFGCRSFASFPLYVSDRLQGSINLYAGEEDFFDEEEVKLLDELSMDISFALEVNQQEIKRRRIEKELRESEERFRSLYENSTVGIYRSTPQGKVLLANPALIRILGFSSFEQLSNRDLNQDAFETSNERVRFIKKIEKEGEIKGLEFKWKKKDGTLVVIRESARAVKDANGKTLHYDGIIEDITDQKKAEIALRTSESQLSNALEIGHLGHWEYDVLKDQFTFNDQFYKLFHTTAEQVGGYTMSSSEYAGRFVYADDIPVISKEIKAAIDTPDPNFNRQLEHRILYADGNIGYITVRFIIEKDQQGRTVKTYGVNQDITERKLAEEKIKQSEQEYRRLFESAHDAILILNPESEIVLDVNERACEVYGFSKSEFIGMSLEKITKNVAAGKAKVEKILKEGFINNFETVQRTKSGKNLVIEVNASMIDYKGNKAILSLNHDITQRKKAEEDIIILSKAVVQSPASIIITDVNGNMEYVNPMFTMVTGYSLEEVIGKTPQILKSGYHSKDFYANLWSTILSGKDFSCEMYNKKKNGTFFWENVLISPIVNETGEITQFVAVKEDITEKKNIIEELIKAKVKAEEMNRLKTTFLTNMSHELRTPLIGLLGLSEAMLDELEGDLKESMDMINQSGQRLLRTLSTILDYSKVESEKIEIVLSEVSVNDLLKKQVKLYRAFAHKKGVNIIEDFKLNDIKFSTDEKLLYDIVNNLLNNAVKFTSRGTITLSAYKNEKQLIIKVSDTGIGIPQDKLDLVFEEFRQASEGTSRSFEGTGLGLAIAKKYTLLLNGIITVESKVGKGSTFTVKLPLNFNKDSLVISNDKSKLPDDKVQKNGFKKILLVEDDSISRKTIGKMLENDYYIVSVNNAKDAIKNAKNEIYDAILMDINLGRGMDGIQATKVIRKINGYESIPIIAMTAYAMEKDKEEFLRCGCSHYIAKPFSIKEILAYLERVLTNQLKNRKN